MKDLPSKQRSGRHALCLRASALALIAVARRSRCSAAAIARQRTAARKPLGETVPDGRKPRHVFPGGANLPPLDPRCQRYESNASGDRRRAELYTQMNCVGCHFHGGGGMGPALMDDEWRYGGRIDQIAARSCRGTAQRHAGMARQADRADQIWQLAAYVRTLSGQQRKDAVSAPRRRNRATRRPRRT